MEIADQQYRDRAQSIPLSQSEIATRSSALKTKIEGFLSQIEQESTAQVEHIRETLESNMTSLRETLENATVKVSDSITDTIRSTQAALNIKQHIVHAPLSSFALAVFTGVFLGSRKFQLSDACVPDRRETPALFSLLGNLASAIIKPAVTEFAAELAHSLVASKLPIEQRPNSAPEPKTKIV